MGASGTVITSSVPRGGLTEGPEEDGFDGASAVSRSELEVDSSGFLSAVVSCSFSPEEDSWDLEVSSVSLSPPVVSRLPEEDSSLPEELLSSSDGFGSAVG